MERKIEFVSKGSNENANSMMFKQNDWINFTVLDIGAGYKVKRFEVLPLKQLSFQSNRFYAEHWTVVQGTAKVTIKNRTFSVKTGETINFGVGEIHNVENPDNSEILVFINVQCGFAVMEEEFISLPEGFDKIADAV
jgi:mannose-6-phosphate isomerase-like protein (cupin superfamily)